MNSNLSVTFTGEEKNSVICALFQFWRPSEVYSKSIEFEKNIKKIALDPKVLGLGAYFVESYWTYKILSLCARCTSLYVIYHLGPLKDW